MDDLDFEEDSIFGGRGGGRGGFRGGGWGGWGGGFLAAEPVFDAAVVDLGDPDSDDGGAMIAAVPRRRGYRIAF